MESFLTLLNHPHVLKMSFLIFSGFVIRQSLVICGQRWANTYHHLGSYLLLPSIALIITSIIKDDIALSLGMIGALSIVRFRNPVKSPFELVIFFGLLTLGIVCSVSLTLSFLLFLMIVFTIFGIKISEHFFSKIGINLFNYSFGDGNLDYTIEIISKKELADISNKKEIIHFFYDHETNRFCYRLSFKDKKELINFKNSLEKFSNILSIRADMQQ